MVDQVESFFQLREKGLTLANQKVKLSLGQVARCFEMRSCYNKKWDQFRFLRNCLPTPPLRKHYHLVLTKSWFSLRAKRWLRGEVGGQFARNLNWEMCTSLWATFLTDEAFLDASILTQQPEATFSWCIFACENYLLPTTIIFSILHTRVRFIRRFVIFKAKSDWFGEEVIQRTNPVLSRLAITTWDLKVIE